MTAATPARNPHSPKNVLATALLVLLAMTGAIPAGTADVQGMCEKYVDAEACSADVALDAEADCATLQVAVSGACSGAPPSCATLLPAAACAGDAVGTCQEAAWRLPRFGSLDPDAVAAMCDPDLGEHCRAVIGSLQEPAVVSELAADEDELDCPVEELLPEDPAGLVPDLPLPGIQDLVGGVSGEAERVTADAVEYATEGPASMEADPCDAQALPVTDVIMGNGGSWFQLFQVPSTGRSQVYASWSLVTNNIGNGADKWAFGAELVGSDGDVQGYNAYRARGGTCKFLGVADPGFSYLVDAGAGGWSSTTECTVSFSWEVSVGVSVSVTGGASESVTLGGSVSCSDGAVFDSESLLRDIGSSDPIICGLPCITD